MTDLEYKSLDWWCRLGRFMAGHDTHPDGPLKAAKPVETLGPLEAAEKRVILSVMDRCEGSTVRASKELRISRSTLHQRLKMWGYTRPRNVVKLAACACALVLCGCAAPITTRTAPQQHALAATELPTIAAAETPMLHTTFAFDASPDASVTGYKLHWGADANNLGNIVDVGLSRTNTIEHDSYPIHAMATAYNAAGIESVPSNQAGVLGKQVVVTGYDQRSDSPAGPFTDAGQVFTRTNPPTTFHRLRIERREELVNYP